MKNIIDSINSFITACIIIIPWLMGIVLAQGFWNVLFTIIFPPYAWYLVVEKAMKLISWI